MSPFDRAVQSAMDVIARSNIGECDVYELACGIVKAIWLENSGKVFYFKKFCIDGISSRDDRIRELYLQDVPMSELVKEFGLSDSYLYRIIGYKRARDKTAMEKAS